MNNPDGSSRNNLFGPCASGLSAPNRKMNIPLNGDEDTEAGASGVMAADVKQMHQQLFREQDRGLDILGEIIQRQKALARGVGQEIEVQNEIIEDIGDHMEQTNERLIRNTRNIKRISMKTDASCCYWIVIILLFIAIVVLAFI